MLGGQEPSTMAPPETFLSQAEQRGNSRGPTEIHADLKDLEGLSGTFGRTDSSSQWRASEPVWSPRLALGQNAVWGCFSSSRPNIYFLIN